MRGMYPYSISKQHGTSLVELIMAMSVGAVIIFGISTGYLTSFRSFRKGSGRVELQRDAAYALETIAKRVREANEVQINYLGAGADNVKILDKDAAKNYRFYFSGNAIKTTTEDTTVPVESSPVNLIPNSDNYIVSSVNFNDPSGAGYGLSVNLALASTGDLNESVVFSTSTYVRIRK